MAAKPKLPVHFVPVAYVRGRAHVRARGTVNFVNFRAVLATETDKADTPPSRLPSRTRPHTR